jgi:hypothetical protein
MLIDALGAGLQFLVFAPKILQALANDGTIPFLKVVIFPFFVFVLILLSPLLVIPNLVLLRCAPLLSVLSLR